MSAIIDAVAQSRGRTIFSRCSSASTGTPESCDAVRQAALLKAPGETMTCLAAWNLEPPLVTTTTVMSVARGRRPSRRRTSLKRRVRSAQAFIPSAESMIVHGFAATR